jgi:uncharacterized membrane protein
VTGRRAASHLPIAITAAAFAAGYMLLSLFKHWHFGSSFDLAIFDQAIWHLSRFEVPASSLRGFPNLFGDHFHPIIVLLAPLYRIAPAPDTLIVAQATLLALSVAPVFAFARRRLPRAAALALAVAYGLFWGMQRTAISDFHEVAFAPVLIASAVLAVDHRRWVWMWVCCIALVLVKEDLIPLVAAMGAYLWVLGERRRGIVLIVGGLVLFVLVVRIVIPWFNAGSGFAYSSAFDEVWRRPWMAPVLLVTPIEKLRTIANWLLPFLFLPLWSPLGLLLAPLAAERLLSSSASHWMAMGHYSAPIAPILAMSAADALSRLASRLRSPAARHRFLTWMASACVLISAVLPGHQPHWRLFTPRHYRDHPTQQTGERALSLIPGQASVVAQAALAPHLSQRQRLYVLEPGAPEADYVLASSTLAPWPAASVADLRSLLDERQARGYAVIFDHNGWVVLRRGQTGVSRHVADIRSTTLEVAFDLAPREPQHDRAAVRAHR